MAKAAALLTYARKSNSFACKKPGVLHQLHQLHHCAVLASRAAQSNSFALRLILTMAVTIPAMALTIPAITGDAFGQDIEHPVRMPAEFHDVLIYVIPHSEDGDTLRFFTDSADGTIMYEGSVDRLGLTTTSAIIQDRQQLAAFLPPMDSSFFIPPPLISDGLIPVRPDDRKPPHHRIILGDGDRAPFKGPGDGILGSTWFAGRAWTIDFREEAFYVVPTDSDDPKEKFQNTVPLTFYEEGDERRFHFGRLEVVVAGDTLSMVLKTGNHIILGEQEQAALAFDGTLFPAGLISESVAERWLDVHPEWKVYEQADQTYGSDLIEVPEVRIGRHSSGPVHFAVRRDEAFEDWFSQFTDEPVTGALGADAFRGARITVNYPWSVLIFHE